MHGVTRPIVSSSTWGNYQFLIPFTALLWRERIGMEPFLLLTGDWQKLERSRLALRMIQAQGFEHLCLPDPGLDEGTLSQNCRQHAAVLPFPEGAWLLTSDADLWPIQREFYVQHLTSSPDTIVSYYANGDHYQSYPTCHIAATAKVWRKAYGLREGIDVAEQTLASHVAWKASSPMYANQANKPFAVWCSDQWMMTEKLKASGFPIRHIERKGHPPVDRIDREGNPENWQGDPARFTDAHVHKGPWEDKRWGDVLRLASGLLPKHAKWFESFRERYLKAFLGQAS